MRTLNHLFEKNKAWAERIRRQDPRLLSRPFTPAVAQLSLDRLRRQPRAGERNRRIWPGELFVHRNVANLVVHTDLNCLSVMQFAVDLLKVRHIIVCGHYGCSGVLAALRRDRLGLSDNWLRHVQDVRQKHEESLAKAGGDAQAARRLCELNVIEQVANVCQTTIALDAWERGQELTVHGWIYGLQDGLLRDLNVTVGGVDETLTAYQTAIAALS